MRLLGMIFVTVALLPSFRSAAASDLCNSTKTADINKCADENYASIDKKLNQEYFLLIKTIPRPLDKDLIVSQKLWISYRDDECKPLGNTEIYRNEAYAEMMHCMTTTSRQRINEVMLLNYSIYADGFLESGRFQDRGATPVNEQSMVPSLQVLDAVDKPPAAS